MTDPYQVLGVSRDAGDDEIKKAYRDLARKYHPDNYVNSPLADLATEKMKEINTAYATIQQERASGRRATDSSASASSGTGGGRTYTGEYADQFRRIREAINAGQYSDAVYMLNAIPPAFHNAEWNFLQGIVLMQKGFFYDAEKCFSNACYMDPSNEEYRMAYQNIHNRATSYNRGFTGNPNSMSGCDICSTLLCADCLCEMCGGDLISCC